MVESKIFYRAPDDEVFRYLKNLHNRCGKVIWVDNRDSAGNTQFEVLPYVDEYWKGQLYADLDNYNREVRFNRLHSEFFADHYDMEAVDVPFDRKLSDYAEHQNKVQLGWNVGFGNYLNLSSLSEMALLYVLKRPQFPEFIRADASRDIDVHCRFRRGGEPIYQCHRDDFAERLQRMDVAITNREPVPRKQFVSEMRRAKIVVSPFGWGEVCYRDFEAVINGSCLVKPSMEHITTWPNIFRANESYIPVRWDLADLESTVLALLRDHDRRLSIANAAQTELQSLYSKHGLDLFAQDQTTRLCRGSATALADGNSCRS
tara:strand:+ start:422 stop:1372 length:951 start_codon:yes stop_codon:yes gene_type:complete